MVRTSPRAVPVWATPTPSVSVIVVLRTAIKPSRAMPAIIKATHIIPPQATDNRAAPIGAMSEAVNRTAFLEPSLSDNKAIGMTPIIPTQSKVDVAMSALAAVHPISRR